MKSVRFVGLDVHAETIAVAVAEAGGEVRSLGTIPNRPEPVKRLVARLVEKGPIKVCYEAGPTGYALYWQLVKLGVDCTVVAPTLVPVKAGDRVKTDRRDAEKLARCFRAGDLTAVWVPDAAHEALRDLVRAREAAKRDQLRAKHRLSKFLLRHGRRPATKTKAWGQIYMRWVRSERFEHAPQQVVLEEYLAEVDHAASRIQRLERAIDEALAQAPPHMQAVIADLQAFRGVARMTAVTVVCEVGQFRRFERPAQLMAYAGVVPGEHSSGERTRRGAITKTGNAHLRRVLFESSWSYRHRPAIGPDLRSRQAGATAGACQVAMKAQRRLYDRYRKLGGAGKPKQVVVTAIARELLGFLWAAGCAAETAAAEARNAA